jgi:hypothetical protein
MGEYNTDPVVQVVQCYMLTFKAASDTHMILDLETSGHDVGHILAKDKYRKSLHAETSPEEVDIGVGTVTTSSSLDDDHSPTEDENKTLRKVAGSVSWSGYMLCFVEAANNASYYGVTGVFANFLQRPLPEGGNGWVRIRYDRTISNVL